MKKFKEVLLPLVSISESDTHGSMKYVRSATNQVEKSVPAYRGPFRHVKKTVPVHEYEIHHAVTGEPLFSIKHQSYGKEKTLEWHPHMQEMHPGIEETFEHGKHHHDRERNRASSKDMLLYRANEIYSHAAASEFKDPIRHTVTPHGKDEYGEEQSMHEFHDENGERLGHAIQSTRYGKNLYGKQFSVDASYLKKHNILPSTLNSLPNHPYFAAKALTKMKGNADKFVATGQHKHGKTETRVYRVVGDPAEASKRHEEQITSKHKKYSPQNQVEITRHGPHAFHAVLKDAEGKSEGTVTSMISGKNLFSHHTDRYGWDPMSDSF